MTAPIRRIPSSGALPASLRGGVVAVGNFDGVHRGHQAVLQCALDEAAARDRPALVLTFEPHPRQLFRPAVPLYRITPAPMRAFSCLPAEDFVARILAADLGIAHVVTGYDFHFGKDRRGTPQFLIEAGKRLGFGVTRVDAFCDEGADAVSSSRIRTLLAGGEVAQAAGLLGYRYTVEAEISHGRKLGRTLGFPTANMALPEGTDLAHGIYAVRLRRQNGALHDGVASFGRRPTVTEDGAALLETFLFDFSGDLYGETACVSFFGFLRGEKKFDGLDVLTAQMKRDEAEARALLSGVAPLSQLDRAIAF
jgi:riboflavin kinase/FMN adenylyltransferase